MFAVYAERLDASDPLSGLALGDRPEPEPSTGWATVRLRAAALNHHDLWSLRGVGLTDDRLPMILGCDGAGVDETLDPKRSLLSEVHPGPFADLVAVPRGNLVPKPAELSWEEAACLPTAWLTAYRMLFTRGALKPGQTVLVQGAGGGVATAAIALAHASGARVWTTSRSEDKRSRAVSEL